MTFRHRKCLKSEKNVNWQQHTYCAYSRQNVICDVWVIWEPISQKLIFWWHSWEAWVRSGYLSDYLGFLEGDFFHSTSISPSGGFLFFFLLLRKGSVRNVWCPFLKVQCHCIRWGIPFHLFWPQIRSVFLVVFSIWRGTLTFHCLLPRLSSLYNL